MQDPINKIWDMVDEVVEENLELFLEDELEATDYASNFESILEDSSDDADYEGYFDEDDLSEPGFKEISSVLEDDWEEPQEKDMGYWLKEFESIIEDKLPVAVQGEKPANSRLPLILGGGGIILLGLVTSTTVLIRLKRGQRFHALPVVEEEPVEVAVEVTPTLPEPKKISRVPMVPGPLFMLNQIVQNLMGPLYGGRHEKHDHPARLRG